MRSLRAALYFAGAASLGINALLLWPILAHLVSVREFGQFAVGLAAVAVLAPLLAGGLHMFVLRETADPDLRTQEVGSTVAATALGAFLCLTVLLIPVALLGGYVCAVLMAAVAAAAGLTATSHARGMHLPVRFALLTVATQTVAVAIAGLVLAATESQRLAFLALAVACLLPALLYAMRSIHSSNAFGPRRAMMVAALRFSLPLVPHLVMLLLMLQGVRIVIGLTLGYEAAAEFQFAATLGGFGITVMILLNGNWSATALRKSGEEFEQYCHDYGRWLAMASVAVTLGTAVASLTLLDFWLPSDYSVREIAVATLIFLPGAPLQALGDIQSTLALKARESTVISVATVSGTAAAVIVVVAMSQVIGIAAGGLSITVGLLVRAVAAHLLQHRGAAGAIVSPPLYWALALSIAISLTGLVVVGLT